MKGFGKEVQSAAMLNLKVKKNKLLTAEKI